jgi:dihydrofolate synthase/folylpolyglutamate synthase
MHALIECVNLSSYVAGKENARFIHVAGTNGKGSVTAYLQSIFVESGFQAGAFFSPYVYDIRERVQQGRHLISSVDLARLTFEMKPIAESFTDTEFGGVTEFEFKAALGFVYWKEKHCDWVALEVGLGGRLDATNVVMPAASVVVSIGLDHTSILGNSYTEIAHEKAGIIKPGIPVVVGQMVPEAMAEIVKEAVEKKSPIWRLGHEIAIEPMGVKGYRLVTPARTHEDLKPGLYGQMQVHNMALAVAAIDASGCPASETAIYKGVRHASLPGRFEHRVIHGRDVILDGAHNAEAATVLSQSLRDRFPGRRIVMLTGMVAGHDSRRFYTPLAPIVDAVHIAPIDFHRAIAPSVVAESLVGLIDNVHVHDRLEQALEQTLSDAADGDLVVVTGSFYLIGELARLMR